MKNSKQNMIPELDDTTFKREKRSRRQTRKAMDDRDTSLVPKRACAHCKNWIRTGDTTMGECMQLRVMKKRTAFADEGEIVARPDDDRTMYGELFDPLRTHQTFRACSLYERIAEKAA